ncbi:MAG: cysteine desulfurase family protein [Xanthobacteraceae bacterium]
MGHRAYLDWNATAPLRPEARAALLAACDVMGNPSSIHAEGRAARAMIEEARRQVAALVGAEPRNVIFTSGGTEANLMALSPALEQGGDRASRDRLLLSAIEHPSVRCGGRFPAAAVEEVPVGPDGRVDLVALEQRLAAVSRAGERPLVSIMLANNETGVIQPIGEAAQLVHQAGGLLHVDAVQGVGKIPCNISEMGADLIAISAHKLGGPKGVGALVRRDEMLHLGDPLVKGGGQERGGRAGTENVGGIAAFGAASAAAAAGLSHERARIVALRDRLEAGLLAISPGAVIFGAGVERLPNTTLFAVPGVKAETALIALDLAGVAVSSGSACSSGKVAASHVLTAMGVAPRLGAGAIRVSLGFSTSDEEVDCFLEAWNKLVRALPKSTHGMAA